MEYDTITQNILEINPASAAQTLKTTKHYFGKDDTLTLVLTDKDPNSHFTKVEFEMDGADSIEVRTWDNDGNSIAADVSRQQTIFLYYAQ